MTDHKPMPIFDDSTSHTPHARPADDDATTIEPGSPPTAEPADRAVPDAAPSEYVPPVVSEDQVRAALRKVKDPELNLNILDLGLVYEISVVGSAVHIDMSLTSPGCPSGPEIMTNAEQTIRALPGVTDVTINLVWTPFWSPERIEPRIRAYLGL